MYYFRKQRKKKDTFDRKFEDNMLVVGKTGRGKTYFAQRIAVNNLFGELKKAERVSQKGHSAQIEVEIQFCFAMSVEFHYPSRVEKLHDLLVHFKKISNGDADF